MENVYPVLMVPYILGMVNVLPVLMDKLKWMAFVSTVQIIVLPTFLGQGLLEFIYLDRTHCLDLDLNSQKTRRNF